VSWSSRTFTKTDGLEGVFCPRLSSASLAPFVSCEEGVETGTGGSCVGRTDCFAPSGGRRYSSLASLATNYIGQQREGVCDTGTNPCATAFLVLRGTFFRLFRKGGANLCGRFPAQLVCYIHILGEVIRNLRPRLNPELLGDTSSETFNLYLTAYVGDALGWSRGVKRGDGGLKLAYALVGELVLQRLLEEFIPIDLRPCEGLFLEDLLADVPWSFEVKVLRPLVLLLVNGGQRILVRPINP
jgi:hypothetical protein